MKKLITIVFAIFLLASCKEKTNEDFVKESFMNYVQTDFDDPDSFEEITSIQPIDTLDKRILIELSDAIEDFKHILYRSDLEKFNEYKAKIAQDKTFIVTYEVKTRVKKNNRKRVETYYVIDNGTGYKVQDHKLRLDESPELYEEIINFVDNAILSKY